MKAATVRAISDPIDPDVLQIGSNYSGNNRGHEKGILYLIRRIRIKMYRGIFVR